MACFTPTTLEDQDECKVFQISHDSVQAELPLSTLRDFSNSFCKRFQGKSMLCSFLTKSLLFYIPTKTQETDVGVKTHQLRKVEKQPVDLPFWPETQKDSIFPLVPNQVPPYSFPCLSICIPGFSVLSITNSCQLVVCSTPDSTLSLLTVSRVHNANILQFGYAVEVDL